MPTKKQTTPRNTFVVALKHAEAEYAKKIKERSAANSALTRLNGEIPNLEAMIRVLKNQLHPGSISAGPESGVAYGSVPKVELGEVPEGAGSILANPDGSTPQQTTPDINSIPGMEGEWT